MNDSHREHVEQVHGQSGADMNQFASFKRIDSFDQPGVRFPEALPELPAQ